MGRALMHGLFVALVVVLAVARPDLGARTEPPAWMQELCAEHAELCEGRGLSGE